MSRQTANPYRQLVFSISRRIRVAAVAVLGTDSAVPTMNDKFNRILPGLGPCGPDGVSLSAV